MSVKPLQIVADENISGLEYFEALGNVQRISGRTLSAQSLSDADALLVRSVTTVDKQLLEHSSVRFVASATSGIDHVDLDYLKAADIAFAYAPGCNANSVVQYVFSALAFLSEKDQFDWRKLSIGIIGGGRVGSLLAANLQKLEMNFFIHDPFLDTTYSYNQQLAALEKVLAQDIVTVHTSLEKGGMYPSYHLLNENNLSLLKSEAILINAARGAVLDNQAFTALLSQNSALKSVLDVWESEPGISESLLKQVDLGTSHIAGYSLEGKEQGSAQIYQALVDYFEINEAPTFPLDQEKTALKVKFSGSALQQINRTILAAYNIQHDDQQLREALGETASLAQGFDLLRKNYPLRREFQHFQLDHSTCDEEAIKVLDALGFSQL